MASCKIQESKKKVTPFHTLHVLVMNNGLLDRVGEVGSETWKGCE